MNCPECGKLRERTGKEMTAAQVRAPWRSRVVDPRRSPEMKVHKYSLSCLTK